MQAIYKQIIKPGSLCFDIGAYRGVKMQAMLDAGAGQVIAVEPQPRHIANLRCLYGTDPRVTTVETAVSDHAGYMNLNICDQADTIATLSDRLQTKGRFHKRGFKWSHQHEVRVTTLDNLISVFGAPHFCKIDVEAHESEALLGLSNQIPYISFEFLEEFIDLAKFCLQRITQIQPSLCNYSLGESGEFASDLWCYPEELFEFIKNAPDHDPEWGKWGDIYVMRNDP